LAHTLLNKEITIVATRSENFHAALASISDEELTEMDARVERRLKEELPAPEVRWNIGLGQFHVVETPTFLARNIDGPQMGDITVVCQPIGRLGGETLYSSGTGDLFQYDSERQIINQVTEPDVCQFKLGGGLLDGALGFCGLSESGHRLIDAHRELGELKQTIRESVSKAVDNAFVEFARRKAADKAKQVSPPLPSIEGLSVRALRALRRAGIDDEIKLRSLTLSQLRAIDNCGSNTVNEIRAWANSNGVEIK
jgi:hypothetical protein